MPRGTPKARVVWRSWFKSVKNSISIRKSSFKITESSTCLREINNKLNHSPSGAAARRVESIVATWPSRQPALVGFALDCPDVASLFLSSVASAPSSRYSHGARIPLPRKHGREGLKPPCCWHEAWRCSICGCLQGC